METFPVQNHIVNYLAPARALSQHEEWSRQACLTFETCSAQASIRPGREWCAPRRAGHRTNPVGSLQKDTEGTQHPCPMCSIMEPPSSTQDRRAIVFGDTEHQLCSLTSWEHPAATCPDPQVALHSVTAIVPSAHWPVHMPGLQFPHLSGTFRWTCFQGDPRLSFLADCISFWALQ